VDGEIVRGTKSKRYPEKDVYPSAHYPPPLRGGL
jgi:hypothetical protein